MSVRVYELAKELNKSNKEILDFLKSKNIELKSHMSNVEASQADMVRANYRKGNLSSAGGDAAKQEGGEKPKKKIIQVFRPQNASHVPERRQKSQRQANDGQEQRNNEKRQNNRQGENRGTQESMKQENNRNNRSNNNRSSNNSRYNGNSNGENRSNNRNNGENRSNNRYNGNNNGERNNRYNGNNNGERS
ncbi:MAG: translation initiation factor IF-2 N-terminal domain-containing protein, partial [Blautia sp.]